MRIAKHANLRGWGWGGLQAPHFLSQMKISTLLLGRMLKKSCKVTKTRDEYDAPNAGNGVSKVLISPKSLNGYVFGYEFDLSLRTNYAPRALYLPTSIIIFTHYTTAYICHRQANIVRTLFAFDCTTDADNLRVEFYLKLNDKNRIVQLVHNC